jgi:uncharacterized protein YgiM (DUF1202 family)
MDFERIGQMASGDKAAVTARSDTDNNWLQVEFDGETGWVAYFTVTVSGDLSALPIVDLEPEP